MNRNKRLVASLMLVAALLASACAGAERQEVTSTANPSTATATPSSDAASTHTPSSEASTTSSGEEGGYEKVLNILYWQSASHANPYLSDGFKEIDAGAPTLEPLANYDPDGNLVPNLAEEIPTVTNGGVAEDFTSIT